MLAAVVDPASAAPKLRIDVIDSGIGMKPEVLNRIFQPFAQADTSITRRFGGTGLGLSISRQIAEALGGAIEVASTYGTGSTFSVIVQTGTLANVRMLDAAEAGFSRGRPSRRWIGSSSAAGSRASGRRWGFQPQADFAGAPPRGVTIIEAENGQIGSELALAEPFDVILMDMEMPVMDGYAAAALLRSKGLKTPIIALTAHAMRGDEEKCRSAGCTGFLTKPIDMDLLVRTIGETVGQKPTVASQLEQNTPHLIAVMHMTKGVSTPHCPPKIRNSAKSWRSLLSALAIKSARFKRPGPRVIWKTSAPCTLGEGMRRHSRLRRADQPGQATRARGPREAT